MFLVTACKFNPKYNLFKFGAIVRVDEFIYITRTSVNFHKVCSSHFPEDDSLYRYRQILSSRIDLADLCRSLVLVSVKVRWFTELCSVKMSIVITAM